MTDLTGTTWKKSTRSSANDNCVEVAANDRVVGLRDSKDPNGPALALTPAAFDSFLATLKHGTFDLNT